MIRNLAGRPWLTDCFFLFSIEVLSALPYLFKLGFYTDDWDGQSALAQYSSLGLVATFQAVTRMFPGMPLRPVAIVCGILEFKAFGHHPTPYHVLNLLLLGLLAILIYLVIRELNISRIIAFAVALVYGLLPHYSTDRFWIASSEASLCMVFAMFGIYAMLRAIRPDQRSLNGWSIASIVSLVLSLFSYEVALGLIVAAFATIAWRVSVKRSSASRNLSARLALLSATGVLLLLIVVFKGSNQKRMAYHHHFFPRLGELTWHACVQSLKFIYWFYGLRLPFVLRTLWSDSALGISAICTAALITCCTCIYLFRQLRSSACPGRRVCAWTIVVGFVLFGLGFAIFFPDRTSEFSTPDLSNRVVIASALGAACALVGTIGVACSVFKPGRAQATAFSLAIAVLCGTYSLVVSGIGFFWADAAARQQPIVQSLVTHVHSLTSRSVLLLDGFCRYSGPGIVFEIDWDATGAIRLNLHDNSLVGDVVSDDLHFDNAAVESPLPEEEYRHYTYSDHLFVFNVKSQTLTPLRSKSDAEDYLRVMNPAGNSGCPPAREGFGVPIF
jgi:hypothetical protein